MTASGSLGTAEFNGETVISWRPYPPSGSVDASSVFRCEHSAGSALGGTATDDTGHDAARWRRATT